MPRRRPRPDEGGFLGDAPILLNLPCLYGSTPQDDGPDAWSGRLVGDRAESNSRTPAPQETAAAVESRRVDPPESPRPNPNATSRASRRTSRGGARRLLPESSPARPDAEASAAPISEAETSEHRAPISESPSPNPESRSPAPEHRTPAPESRIPIPESQSPAPPAPSPEPHSPAPAVVDSEVATDPASEPVEPPTRRHSSRHVSSGPSESASRGRRRHREAAPEPKTVHRRIILGTALFVLVASAYLYWTRPRPGTAPPETASQLDLQFEDWDDSTGDSPSVAPADLGELATAPGPSTPIQLPSPNGAGSDLQFEQLGEGVPPEYPQTATPSESWQISRQPADDTRTSMLPGATSTLQGIAPAPADGTTLQR